MREHRVLALDCGTTVTRGVVLEDRGEELPYVVAAADVPSAGVRRGAVVAPDVAAESITQVVRQLTMHVPNIPSHAVCSIGSPQITAQLSKGVVVVSRSDGDISTDDVERVLMAAQAVSLPANKEIIHVLPRRYSVDDQTDVKDPVGMKGVRLDVEALLIDAPTQALRAMEAALHHAGIGEDDFIATPLAVAQSVLDQQARELGVVVVDIGATTTTVAVYEESELIHAAVLPIGAAHVTNDLAIGLRTAVETAEAVKLNYGAAIAAAVDRREECDLSALDPRENDTVSRYHVAQIIQARMEEIFSLVQTELQRIKKAELLPGGVVLTGGGAKIPYCVPLAKEVLRLPVRRGEPQPLGGMFDRVDDPAYATVVGTALFALRDSNDGGVFGRARSHASMITQPLGGAAAKLRTLFEKIFP